MVAAIGTVISGLKQRLFKKVGGLFDLGDGRQKFRHE
jgi:hypothetical protein